MAPEGNMWRPSAKLVHPLVKFVRVARTTQWPVELPAPPSPNVLSRELECWRKTTTMTCDTVTPMASFHFFKKFVFERSVCATVLVALWLRYHATQEVHGRGEKPNDPDVRTEFSTRIQRRHPVTHGSLATTKQPGSKRR